MRVRVLLVGLLGLLAAGFRCPGSDPSALPTTASGGAGGEPSTPEVSSVTTSTSTSTSSAGGAGGVGGYEPLPFTCEGACEGCSGQDACGQVCTAEQNACGQDATEACFDAHPCAPLQVGVCLVADHDCVPSLELTCKVLCAAMLTRCANDPQRTYATPATCVGRCQAGFSEECGTNNQAPPPPGDILACGADAITDAGCNLAQLDYCAQSLCSFNWICPSTWIDVDPNAPCVSPPP